jgi:hypothetical protein
MDGKFISYLRVSTVGQGQSGLGLDAQRDAVQHLLNGGNHRLLGEYVEVETGKNNARPQLARIEVARRLGSRAMRAGCGREHYLRVGCLLW